MSGIIIYLCLVNVIAYLLMWIDKKKAIKHRRRIAEKTLFALAWIGGSFGIWIGMIIFHHKIRKWNFKLGIPILLFLQITLSIWILSFI